MLELIDETLDFNDIDEICTPIENVPDLEFFNITTSISAPLN